MTLKVTLKYPRRMNDPEYFAVRLRRTEIQCVKQGTVVTHPVMAGQDGGRPPNDPSVRPDTCQWRQWRRPQSDVRRVGTAFRRLSTCT